MNILMVLTSHDELGDTGRKTGFWLEEFAAPYYAFLEAGADITVASPKGGQPPLDPKSDEPSFQTEQTRRFHADPKAQSVCHAPGVLRHVKAADGTPLVLGKNVTGFKNTEEDGVGLTDVVPFLVEDMLKHNGGIYSSGDDWASYAVQDGLLITGQNPGSSVETARILLTMLKVGKAA
jgi:putative intracellular protease/amidase